MKEYTLLNIKEYILGVLLTIEAPISDIDKLKEIDKLMIECLNKEIDPILNKKKARSKNRTRTRT